LKGCGDRVVYASIIYCIDCIDGIGRYGLQFYSGRIALRGASHSNNLQFLKSRIATQCPGKGIGRKTNQHAAECGGDDDCAGSRAR
jgi:hypothetical protein